jgi:TPR repeat protein
MMWLERAADQGDVWAIVNMGVMHVRGDGMPVDHARAVDLFREAAEMGNTRAHLNLWSMYREHEAPGIDREEALRSLETAVEADIPKALYQLAMERRDGGAVPADPSESERLLTRAAEAEHLGAMDELALLFVNEGRNYDRAMSIARRGAELGSAPSMNTVGVILTQGLGVPEDPPEALAWFRRAVEAGSLDARRNLGIFYENGMGGLPADLHAAASWFDYAMDGGLSRASADVRRVTDRIASAPEAEGVARYWYGEGGQAQGPVSFDALMQHRQAGTVRADSFVWREGMDEWVRFAEMFSPGR